MLLNKNFFIFIIFIFNINVFSEVYNLKFVIKEVKKKDSIYKKSIKIFAKLKAIDIICSAFLKKIEKLSSQKKMLIKKLTKLHENILQTRKNYEEILQELKNFKKKSLLYRNKYNFIKNSLKETRAENKKIEEKYKNRIIFLEKKIIEAKKENDSLKTDLLAFEKIFIEFKLEKNLEIEELGLSIEILEKDSEKNKELNLINKNQIKNLKDEILLLKEQKKELSRNNKKLIFEINSKNFQLKKNEENIKKFEVKLGSLEKKIKHEENEKKRLFGIIENLKVDKNHLIKNYKNEKFEYENEKKEFLSEIDKVQKKLSLCEEELTLSKEENERLILEKNSLISKNEELKKDLNNFDLKKEKSCLEIEIEKLNGIVLILQEKIDIMTYNLRLEEKSQDKINIILNKNYKDAQLKYEEEIEKLNKEIEKLNKSPFLFLKRKKKKEEEVEIEIVDDKEEFPKNSRLEALRNQFNFISPKL